MRIAAGILLLGSVQFSVTARSVDAQAPPTCEHGRAQARLEANGVSAKLFNNGNLFWDQVGSVSSGYNVPRGSNGQAIPGAAHLITEPDRWARYIRNSLIETSISRDVLLLTRVDKPALLRRFFELGCRYSGQVLSYTKILGQLQDAGNTTTLAHYLDLLAAAGMMTGIQKYAGSAARRRGSSPKFQVLNTGLMTATLGFGPNEAKSDPQFWGRLTESAVGAHFANAAAAGDCELFYWRDRNREVDFVARAGRRLLAVEVKSSARRNTLSGLEAFAAAFKPDRTLLVGPEGVPLKDFLSRPVIEWIE